MGVDLGNDGTMVSCGAFERGKMGLVVNADVMSE